MKHIQSYQNFNESILLGKFLGNISKGVDKLKRIIGFSGEDEDLAQKILDFLNQKLKNSGYKSDTRFDKSMIHRPIPNQFVFFKKGLFNAKDEIRVDVVKVSDPSVKLDDDPYRVYISIVTKRIKGGIPGHQLLITANPKADEKMEQLECSTQIAEKIWKRCEEIHKIETPTTRGRSRGANNSGTNQSNQSNQANISNQRGGSNIPQPNRSGNIFKRLGLSW